MKIMTGLEYLKVAIANAYGLDKELWATRINWTDTHEGTLETYMDKADNPFQYIKAVKALRNTQLGKPTGYIMGLDACASGYQIMGCMTGCKATLQRTNVINTGNREDLYDFINNKMIIVTKIHYARNDVKKTIMTTAYGSKKQPEQLYGKGTTELEQYWDTMYNELPGSMQLMELIQQLWNPNAIRYTWELPDGHIVIMDVEGTIDKKIEVDELDHATFTHRSTVIMPKPKGLSLAANVMHSIDAYIVREMVRRCAKKNVQVAPIHDAFYASPNDMQLVRETYRNILAELAQSNLMQSILNNIANKHVPFNKLSKNLSPLIMQNEYALS